MDRPSLKRRAAEVIRSQKRPILLTSFLYFVLVVLFSYLSMRLTMPPTEDLLRISNLYYAGRMEEAQRLAMSFQPGFGQSLASDLLSYVQAIVAFGFLILLLNAIRGQPVVPGMLLDGFGSWAKVLLLELLTRLIVTLGLFLLIVPGILFSFNYRMAPYLLLTRPEYGVIDCLRESRLRMRGHRLELFKLDLSFLGWALLAAIPLLGIPAAIILTPYWNCSCLLFFEALCAEEGRLPSSDDSFPGF